MRNFQQQWTSKFFILKFLYIRAAKVLDAHLREGVRKGYLVGPTQCKNCKQDLTAHCIGGFCEGVS